MSPRGARKTWCECSPIMQSSPSFCQIKPTTSTELVSSDARDQRGSTSGGPKGPISPIHSLAFQVFPKPQESLSLSPPSKWSLQAPQEQRAASGLGSWLSLGLAFFFLLMSLCKMTRNAPHAQQQPTSPCSPLSQAGHVCVCTTRQANFSLHAGAPMCPCLSCGSSSSACGLPMLSTVASKEEKACCLWDMVCSALVVCSCVCVFGSVNVSE